MTSPAPIQAVQHVKRMRGGAQSHLMRASDGNFYVVKFQNNPQHVRVLANELFATRLAAFLGLPVPDVQIIEVSQQVIENNPELSIRIADQFLPCIPGLHLGSRYAADLAGDLVFDYLPESLFERVNNRQDFARVLAFDKWTGNCDGRQAVFTKKSRQRGYQAVFIDQGYCFNAAEWTFPDLALHGVYYQNHVYEQVTAWEAFEPLLSRIEGLDYGELWRCATEIPHEWFEHDGEGLFSLIETLHLRRPLVRHLISAFRNSSRNPFPQWNEAHVAIPQTGSFIKQEEARPESVFGETAQ
jgi:HipA-like protein